jgi:hypothetical protein
MVIPVTIETATKIDAENGSITNEQKPWWTFLTTS